MWSVGPEPTKLAVYVSSRAIAICQNGVLLHTQPSADEFSALEALTEWIEREVEGRARVTIHLSGALCRPFLSPPLPKMKAAERAIAEQAIIHRKAGLADPCALWRGDVQDTGSYMFAALPKRLLEGINRLPRIGKAIEVASIRPLWSEVLKRVIKTRPQASSLVVRDCDSISVFAGNGEHFELATCAAPVVDDALAINSEMRLLSTLDDELMPMVRARLVATGTSLLPQIESDLNPLLEVML